MQRLAAFYFCYDGVCGSTTVAGADPVMQSAPSRTIMVTRSFYNGDDTYYDNVFTITMPIGKSCDGLEMRAKTIGSAVKIVKTVDKHNNGKVFKITRSFLQDRTNTPGAPSAAGEFTFTNGEGHSALARVSTLVVSDKTSCPAKTATDYDFPFNRVVTGFATAHGGAAAVVQHAALDHDAIIDAM